MTAYYNEIDKKTAAWLRKLIDSGLIAKGEVDERSITEVTGSDLKGFSQCHFFAGIGGWSYALRLAGIPDDQPIWTGSCPCQPFSQAGKHNGKSDERHLWPEFYRLIKQCRPDTVFGEQVESAIKYGWLDDLQADLERESYSVGAAVLGAHSVNAPHKRQRLYWVADRSSKIFPQQQREPGISRPANERIAGKNADRSSCMGNTNSDGRPSRCEATEASRYRNTIDTTSWSNPDWIICADGKQRPVKSGIQCLANRVSARVVRLRGYGNAIVPQVAAEFITAFYEVMQ